MTSRSAFGITAVLVSTILACSPARSARCDAPSDAPTEPGSAGYALLFCGTGIDDVDRVKIVVDDPRTDHPGPPADVGATDFTLEWWMKATLADNRSDAVECGENINWIHGNIVFDRDRYHQGRKYGVSLAGGLIVFGVSGAGDRHYTICGETSVADGAWHHVAVQRSIDSGRMTLYVDGRLEADGVGPLGDVSYPDDGVPGSFCGGLCFRSDPYLVIAAEKHDAGPQWPAYTGWVDEVRLSTTLRYGAAFERPTAPFPADSATAALWHFDEGEGHVLFDSSLHGTEHGLIHIGGPWDAPHWVVSDAPIR